MPRYVQICGQRFLFRKQDGLFKIGDSAPRISAQTTREVILMSKQGMARPDRTHTNPRNSESPVPLIQGKAKHGKAHAKPIIPGTSGSELKVYHQLKGDGSVGDAKS